MQSLKYLNHSDHKLSSRQHESVVSIRIVCNLLCQVNNLLRDWQQDLGEQVHVGKQCAQRFVDGVFINMGTFTRIGDVSFQTNVTRKICVLAYVLICGTTAAKN